MTVTRAVIDAMIATGVPEEQAAGLADGLRITSMLDVDSFVAFFPAMNFFYAMSVPREVRASFIRWHNANCFPDDVWELADEAWEDIDWPEFEQTHRANVMQYLAEQYPPSQSTD